MSCRSSLSLATAIPRVLRLVASSFEAIVPPVLSRPLLPPVCVWGPRCLRLRLSYLQPKSYMLH